MKIIFVDSLDFRIDSENNPVIVPEILKTFGNR